MMNFIKKILAFFKKAEQIAITLESKMDMALQLGSMARNIFSDALDQLQLANNELDNIKKQADEIIKQHQSVADQANLNRVNNIVTINNIEKLIGVENTIQGDN